MYQKSRGILIFLIVVFSVVIISSTVIAIIETKSFESGKIEFFVKGLYHSHGRTPEELIFSGNHQCAYMGDNLLLTATTWVLGAIWEVLALCLAIWITVKNFRELPSGWTLRDLLTVLIRTHVFYFAL